MLTQVKNIASKIQTDLEERLKAYPVVQKSLDKALETEAGVFLRDKAKVSEKHLRLLLKGFPQDLKSVKPYIKIQKKNLETWRKDFATKASSKKSRTKSKSSRRKSQSET